MEIDVKKDMDTDIETDMETDVDRNMETGKMDMDIPMVEVGYINVVDQ
jgi:hypothetical protein